MWRWRATMRNARSSRRGSLVVVGAGIRLAAHLTAEALACLQRAEKVFYLFFDPVAEAWIRRLNPAAETLQDCFADHKPRRKTYREITDRLLSAVRSGLQVCAVCYGHPGVFAEPFHRSVRRAYREGYSSRMLPGISAEDCLFADLGVDPGKSGCQSFEATDFLAARRRFDPTSVLILWQVGVLGEPGIRPDMCCRPERLRVLTAFLRRSYPMHHPVVLYEASYLPIGDPRIKHVHLSRLPNQTIVPLTTLYIPPRRARRDDPKIARWFHEVEPA
jgi:tetrapyrrole (corrin/porphyrin) methylase-like protein